MCEWAVLRRGGWTIRCREAENASDRGRRVGGASVRREEGNEGGE